MLKLKHKKGNSYTLDGYIGGKRFRQTFEAPSRKQAQAYRAERERELWDRNALGAQGDATIAECASLYIDQGGEERFLIPIIERWGEMRVRDLTAREVSRGAQEIYPGRQASTVRRQLYVPLNALIRHGHKNELCPLVHFDPPRVGKKELDYADDEWMRAFLAEAATRGQSGFRIATLVLFMTMTGARISEALRLQGRDLDDGYAILRKTKTKPRRVRVPANVYAALCRLSEGGQGQRVFDGIATRDSANKRIRSICEGAGIRYLSSHKCGRHAFAARLLRQGESVRVVQEAGGWASIRLVGETYGHIERSQVDDAIDRMGQNFLEG